MSNKIDMSIDVKESLDKLEGILRRIAQPKPVLDILGQYLVEAFRKNIRTEGHGEWDKSAAATERGGKTLRDRGRFYNSFGYEVNGNEVTAGPNSTQARILREGGEIKPKKAKFLTIPIHKLARRKRMADFADQETYPLFSEKDKGVIMLARKRAEDIPIFALVKKVTIPGWDYMKLYKEDYDRMGNIVVRQLMGEQGV